MRLPTVACDYLGETNAAGALTEIIIRINTFKSKALAKGAAQKGNRETLSLVMVDYDYNGEGEVFEMDTVFYAGDLEKNNWSIRLPAQAIGRQMMIIYLDIYGNEYKETKTPADFQPIAPLAPAQEAANG